MNFLKKIWAAAKLAALSQFEYRFNFVIDALIQPSILAFLEVTFWSAIIGAQSQLAGFDRSSYIAYSLWAAVFSRVAANWMYEYKMVEEIDTGRLNTLILRPFSFYEYYLGQFLGYKVVTCSVSILIPMVIVPFLNVPMYWDRLPLSFAMILYYLIFTHTLSFIVASLALYLTRTHSFTAAKNLLVILLTGEAYPLDLLPQTIKQILLHLPFAAGVYLPVGFLIGRVSESEFYLGFVSITMGLLVTGVIARVMWMQGIRRYTGTGA